MSKYNLQRIQRLIPSKGQESQLWENPSKRSKVIDFYLQWKRKPNAQSNAQPNPNTVFTAIQDSFIRYNNSGSDVIKNLISTTRTDPKLTAFFESVLQDDACKGKIQDPLELLKKAVAAKMY